MKWSVLTTTLLTTFSSLQTAAAQDDLLTNVTIFTPPRNYTVPRTLYARTLLLNQNCKHEDQNTLLATWENYLPNNNSFPYMPIYQSLDLGETWTERSRVYDQVNGWGLRYQPFLYELAEPIGEFEKGTVLLAASSIPDDLSETQIDLYASKDKGYTWKFVSHIAHGGLALPNNGLTPVWEPYLMTYQGEMICYYSDQRDNATYGQKLVHQVSPDLLSWGPVVDDVAQPKYTDRPGMPIVSELPNGKYFFTYEFGGGPVDGNSSGDYTFPVFYRISSDPLDFDNAEDHALVATDGTVPVSSPYNVWTPAGGENGTIVVTCGTLSEVFINQALGAEDAWVKVETPEGVSYTRTLLVLPDKSEILITGAGELGGKRNKVTTSSIDLDDDE
ncbi:uncharacterized protein LTR77_007203 [Saxophila tyrrhenica]|uniref:Uncharacterized protein n=1 Tax=Saxophila tyrrhenica TaxID=1690608 RepID=A0AAV9P3X0_9PEZI|nr:hypothetical protein LTR77_007203 [Saxophila tyrrhenica]